MQVLASNFKIDTLTYFLPLVVAVRPKDSVSRASLGQPNGSFARFSKQFSEEMKPFGSCLYVHGHHVPTPGLMPVQRVEGYHLDSCSLEERQILFDPDGNIAVLRVVLCIPPYPGLVERLINTVRFVREHVIPNASHAAGDDFMEHHDMFVFELSEILAHTKDLLLQEFSRNDILTLPIAFPLLLAATGPAGLAFVLVAPVSFCVACALLDTLSDLGSWHKFSYLGPPIFICLTIALSLDYVLLLLWRFNEELDVLVQDLGTLGESCTEPSGVRIRRNIRDAVDRMVRQAGFSVFTSGMILAASFACVGASNIAEPNIVTIGVGGAVFTITCLLVALSICPATLLCIGICAPRSLLRCPCNPASSFSHSTLGRWIFIPWARTSVLTRWLATERPRLAFLGTLLLMSPLLWRATLIRPDVDNQHLMPLSSPWKDYEDIIGQAGLPRNIITTNYAVLRWEGAEVASGQTAPNSTNRCRDKDRLLSAYVPSLMQKDMQSLTWSCTLVDSVLCNETQALKMLAPKASAYLAQELAKEIVVAKQHLCPRTCQVCGHNEVPLLSEEVFDALLLFETLYQKAIDEVLRLQHADSGQARSNVSVSGHAGKGLLLHIAKLGTQVISAADARRYVGLEGRVNRSERAIANAYCQHYAQLVGFGGNVTKIIMRPLFRSFSSEMLRLGMLMEESLENHGNKQWSRMAQSSRVNISLYMPELGMVHMSDRAYAAFDIASVVAVALLALLTGAVFCSLVLPLRLVLTVLLTLGVSFGACQVLVAQYGLAGVYWIIPILTTPILAGLTLDYDLFILNRVREARLRGLPTKSAFQEGLEQAQVVISIAGIIMSLAFSAMLSSDLLILREIGLIMVVGTLCDTFIIRPLVVPACALAVGDPEVNWWPRRMPPIVSLETEEDECELRYMRG